MNSVLNEDQGFEETLQAKHQLQETIQNLLTKHTQNMENQIHVLQKEREAISIERRQYMREIEKWKTLCHDLERERQELLRYKVDREERELQASFQSIEGRFRDSGLNLKRMPSSPVHERMSDIQGSSPLGRRESLNSSFIKEINEDLLTEKRKPSLLDEDVKPIANVAEQIKKSPKSPRNPLLKFQSHLRVLVENEMDVSNHQEKSPESPIQSYQRSPISFGFSKDPGSSQNSISVPRQSFEKKNQTFDEMLSASDSQSFLSPNKVQRKINKNVSLNITSARDNQLKYLRIMRNSRK